MEPPRGDLARHRGKKHVILCWCHSFSLPQSSMPHDYVVGRGSAERPSVAARLTWIAARTIDVPLALWFFRNSIGSELFSLLSIETSPVAESRALAITGLLGITSLRHVFWILKLVNTPMKIPGTLMVAGFNAVMTSVVLGAAAYSGRAPFLELRSDYVALGLFAVGSFFETVGEIQRQWFKADPKNKGKLFTSGFSCFTLRTQQYCAAPELLRLHAVAHWPCLEHRQHVAGPRPGWLACL